MSKQLKRPQTFSLLTDIATGASGRNTAGANTTNGRESLEGEMPFAERKMFGEIEIDCPGTIVGSSPKMIES